MESTTNRAAAVELLREWVLRRLDGANQDWLARQMVGLPGEEDKVLFVAFGTVPRRFGKEALALSTEEVVAAGRCLQGWSPADWSLTDAGRILLLAILPGQNPDFAARFRSLCQTAEMAEAVSLYRGLPLYPEPRAIEPQVAEGLRGNMRSVFEAIAHHNPYPRQYFDTHRWNQMVLKALFVGSALAPIAGLDERANEELARIMLDFAHERWAAGRPVPFEIWRCIGPFARGAMLADLERALSSDSPMERQAAALALTASPDAAAADLLKRVPDLAVDIAAGRLTWSALR